MDVAPDGEVKPIVNIVPDKVALVPVGVPGALGVPPDVTVIELVGVPGVAPLTARNVIVVGAAPEMVKVPLLTVVGPLGGLGTVIVFQVVPPSELNW